jgi:hypothetical protein
MLCDECLDPQRRAALSRSRAAGRSCGTGDEETQIGHLLDSKGSNPYLDVVRHPNTMLAII